MPIILVGSSFYCFPLWGVVGLGCRVFFLWLDNEQQRKLVVCAQPGFVTLCGLWIFLAFGLGIFHINGEFDPGSGRTLAACLTHASRTVILESLLFG
jgi:hypothetical protein